MKEVLKKIAAAAKCVGLSRDTLRRYERYGWIRPRRDWAGARLYSDGQIVLLRRIRDGLIDPRQLAGDDAGEHGGMQANGATPQNDAGTVIPHRQRGGVAHE